MTISKLHNLDKSIHQNPRRLMALNYAIKKLNVEIDKQLLVNFHIKFLNSIV